MPREPCSITDRPSQRKARSRSLMDLVAQPGGILEFQVFGVFVHLRLQPLDHGRGLVDVQRRVFGPLLRHGRDRAIAHRLAATTAARHFAARAFHDVGNAAHHRFAA